jgi:hypothetical protein
LSGVFVKPDCGVPTGPAYALLDALPRRPQIAATERLLDTLTRGTRDLDAIGAAMHNPSARRCTTISRR